MINRQLLINVTDATTRALLEDIANELGRQAVSVARPDCSELKTADCLVIESQGPEFVQVVEACRNLAPGTPIVALLNGASPSEAIRASRAGCFECLASLSARSEFLSAIQSAMTQKTRVCADICVSGEPWRRQLIGSSAAMDRVTRVIRLVAARKCTVLITGETGTGKEMAARAIHLAGNRARRPMVCVNCSAIPENLIEAELFGHVKGAYTGAVGSRIGRFEQANGGTLFLDEIADLPFELQSKLLRALQEKEIQRLGSSDTLKVDVRVIAATNADLLARVQDGRFREDLYYRLNVVPIFMPALRERGSDIAELVEHFIQKICTAEAIPVKSLAYGALAHLCGYTWPGNVRQLENIVEHAIVMSGDRDVLCAADFAIPQAAIQAQKALVPAMPEAGIPDEGLDFTETLRQFERGILQQAMTRAQGNKTLAADMLRLPRTTLIHKLRVLEQMPADIGPALTA